MPVERLEFIEPQEGLKSEKGEPNPFAFTLIVQTQTENGLHFDHFKLEGYGEGFEGSDRRIPVTYVLEEYLPEVLRGKLPDGSHNHVLSPDGQKQWAIPRNTIRTVPMIPRRTPQAVEFARSH